MCAQPLPRVPRASCLQVADPTAFDTRRAPERAITCYKRKVHSAWGDFTDHEKLCVGSRDHESSDPKGWFAESVALVLAPPDEYVYLVYCSLRQAGTVDPVGRLQTR